MRSSPLTLRSQLAQWRRTGDVRRIGMAALGGAAVGGGLLMTPGGIPLWIRLASGFVVLAVMLRRAWSVRPTLPVLAAEIDASAGSEGLVATALAVEMGRAEGGNDLQGLVMASAAAAAPQLAMHAIPAFRVPWTGLGMGATLTVLGAMAPLEHASPAMVVVRSATSSSAGAGSTAGPPLEAEPADPGSALPRDGMQTAAGRQGVHTDARANSSGLVGVSGHGSGASAGAGAVPVAGEAASDAGAPDRTGSGRSDQPASASQQLMSRPGTGRGDADDGPPIPGGNQGAFGGGLKDEDDPGNPDGALSTGGGEASDKEGGPAEDDPAPPAQTNAGAVPNADAEERREGTGDADEGSPGEPADDGPAPIGGEDARSKDDTRTTGPGAGAGSGAVGTAEAEAEGPGRLPPLPDTLARIELAWSKGGDGTLREVEEAALGQRTAQSWRSLYGDYAAVAEHTLAQDALPPARAAVVRRYFNALSADAAKESP